MTPEEAKHILDKHTGLFNFMEAAREIPDASSPNIQEIFEAMKAFDPNLSVNWHCGDCVFNFMERANNKRKELKFYKFG